MANWWVLLWFLIVCSAARDIRSSLPDLDEIDAELRRSRTDPIEVEGRQIQLLTVTITSASTVTQTIELSEVCAKTVNVTGACRRRRARWLENPIVMTFDDNMDVVDQLLIPRTVQVVEVTAEPVTEIHPRRKVWTSTESAVKPSMEETGRRQTTKTFGLGQNVISQLGSIINRFRGTRTRTTSTSTSTATSSQTETPASVSTQVETKVTDTTSEAFFLPLNIIQSDSYVTSLDVPTSSSRPTIDATVILNTLEETLLQVNGESTSVKSSQDTSNIYQTLQATVILPTLQATIIIPTLQATAIRIETTYLLVTTTRTFFIQKCTPSPFPFPLCTARSPDHL